MQRENPFSNHSSIASNTFFIGRQRAIEAIENRLFSSRDPGAIAIIGAPQMGKKSLIYHITLSHKDRLVEAGFLPIFMNLRSYNDAGNFFLSLIFFCLEELEQRDKITDTIKREADRIRQTGFSWDATYLHMQRFFTAVRQTGLRILFILDEFDHARTLFQEHPMGFYWIREFTYWPEWRVSFIILAQNTLDCIAPRISYISEFAATFASYYLSPFEEQDLQAYFERLASADITITPALKARIHFYCGSHPYLLVSLGYVLVKQMQEEHSCDVDAAAQSIEQCFLDYARTISEFLNQIELLEKFTQILLGPVIDVEPSDISKLLAYGLILQNRRQSNETAPLYLPFSEYMLSSIIPVIKQSELWSLLCTLEQALDLLLATRFQSFYGEDWQGEKDALASDQLQDRIALIFSYWFLFQPVFQLQSYKDQTYWQECTERILILRGPLSTSSFRDEASQMRARYDCQEMLEAIQVYEQTAFSFISTIELTTSSIEENLDYLKDAEKALLLESDRKYTRELQRIFEAAFKLTQQSTFSEQERFCTRIESLCAKLAHSIEQNTTRIARECILPLLSSMQNLVHQKLSNLFSKALPHLTLRLALEIFTPDHAQQIKLQIVVENAEGSTPAQELELFVDNDERYFQVTCEQPIMLGMSVRENERQLLPVPLHLTAQALDEQRLSITFYASYRAISIPERLVTAPISASVQLKTDFDFKPIENPFSRNAYGAVVRDTSMFYGRSELIATIGDMLNTTSQHKAYLIYGQKRSGKSSILYHLIQRLKGNENLLLLDIGNIGAILDTTAPVPLLTQILWAIIHAFRRAIQTEERRGREVLDIPFPTKQEFSTDMTPLHLFNDLFIAFREEMALKPDWMHVRVIVFMDEFSYIHSFITTGQLPAEFMKTWKALLDANYFSLVLVGQDVMPKFISHFRNEFSSIHPERISYLEAEDAKRFIDEPIRIGGRHGASRYRERAIERILQLTAGNPFYIHIFCHHLVEYMNKQQAELVTEADVDQVVHDLLYGRNQFSLFNFDNLISPGDTFPDAIPEEDALQVLTHIALHSFGNTCSRNNITCETQYPLDAILKDLVERDVLVRYEDTYSIRVGLFKEWLIAHHQ
jgi:hypothetical protein